MGSAIYGGICAVRLAQRLLRQANNLWMLGKSALGMRETATPKRSKRPVEESSRQHMTRASPVETTALLSGWEYGSTPPWLSRYAYNARFQTCLEAAATSEADAVRRRLRTLSRQGRGLTC